MITCLPRTLTPLDQNIWTKTSTKGLLLCGQQPKQHNFLFSVNSSFCHYYYHYSSSFYYYYYCYLFLFIIFFFFFFYCYCYCDLFTCGQEKNRKKPGDQIAIKSPSQGFVSAGMFAASNRQTLFNMNNR